MPVPLTSPAVNVERPVLVLEASSSAGSAAVVHSGRCVASIDVVMGSGREDGLFPAAVELVSQAGLAMNEFAGVVCGAGPGSFTSLRIAASCAKGFAHGANLPLYAVSSLLLAAADAVSRCAAGTYLVHSDALRGERYALEVEISDAGLVRALGPQQRCSLEWLNGLADGAPMRLAVGYSPNPERETLIVTPCAAHLSRISTVHWVTPLSLDGWEPVYGRLAEAQVKWEAAHGAIPGRITEV